MCEYAFERCSGAVLGVAVDEGDLQGWLTHDQRGGWVMDDAAVAASQTAPSVARSPRANFCRVSSLECVNAQISYFCLVEEANYAY